MTSDRAFAILAGGLVTFLGYVVSLEGGFYSSKYGRYFEFGRLSWFYGGVLILSGLALIWVGIRPKNKGSRKSSTMVCPKCESPYDVRKHRATTCDTCDVSLEPLKGFYDRHPELKKSSDGSGPR